MHRRSPPRLTNLNQYRVVLEVLPGFQQTPDALGNLYIRPPTGPPVPLSAFSRFSPTTTPLAVSHQGQFPSVTLSSTSPPASRSGRRSRLWPGQFANVELTLTVEPDALVVPAPAVQSGQQGSQFVFVVKPDSTVDARRVTVKRVQGSEAIVAEGLKPGESVVVDGQPRLVAGAKVEVRQPDRAGAGRGKGKGGGGKGDGGGKAETGGKGEAGGRGDGAAKADPGGAAKGAGPGADAEKGGRSKGKKAE